MISLALAIQLMISVPPPELLSQNKDFWISQLRSDSTDLKINALQKLAELRQADIVPRLTDVIRDSNPEVRFHAVRAVAKIPTQDGLKILQGELSEEKDPYLLSEIRRSIQSIEQTLKAAAEKEALKNSPEPKKSPSAKAKTKSKR